MMHVLQQQRTEQPPPVQPPPNQGAQPQAPRGNPVFREFCRMNPPTFEGQYEPTEASEWLFRMEDILEISCDLRGKIVKAQMSDPDLQRKVDKPEFSIVADGAILYNG
ncbi:hypothetical protein A2U01_0043538, partial [Trifolium medium]|nr:hypothetical protein [Trifolium medium]